MNILIDADGCPVVDAAARIAKQRYIACYILCDTAHVKLIAEFKSGMTIDVNASRIINQ